MYIRCIDLETSGEEPDGVDIVEVGWTNLIPFYSDGGDVPSSWELGDTKSMLVDPGRPITPESMGVHHITDAHVAGMYETEEAIKLARDVPDDAILVAHNADYEMSILKYIDIRWIDTWKVAMKLAPTLPSHKLQALRYRLKL